MHAVAKADALQRLDGPLLRFFGGHAGHLEGEGDVVDGRQAVDEVEVLEDPADLIPAHVDHAGRTLEPVGAVVQGNAPCVAGQQAANDVEQGGFARTRRSHEGNHLAFFDGHVHAFQDVEFVGSRPECLREGFYAEHHVIFRP